MTAETTLIPLALVDAGDNDRKFFDEEKLRELAASIQSEGLLQPPVYRPMLVFPCGHIVSTYGREELRELWSCLILRQSRLSATPQDLSTEKAVSTSRNSAKEKVDSAVPSRSPMSMTESPLSAGYKTSGRSVPSTVSESGLGTTPNITVGTGQSPRPENLSSFFPLVCPTCGSSVSPPSEPSSISESDSKEGSGFGGHRGRMSTSRPTSTSETTRSPKSSDGPRMVLGTGEVNSDSTDPLSKPASTSTDGQESKSSSYEPTCTFETARSERGLERPIAPSDQSAGGLDWVSVRAIYQITAGERRTRAVRLLGWETIPAVVREMDDETAATIMLIENVQRQDLSPIEEARAYQSRMNEFGWSIPEVARRANVSDSKVRGRLRLLKLSDIVQQSISSGDIPLVFAETLETLDAARQLDALRWIAQQKQMPTRKQLADYSETLRQRMYQESEVSLFSLDAYNAAEQVMEQTDGKLFRMLPSLDGLPDVRWDTGATAIGFLIDFYIADLIASGKVYAATVIADFWRKVQEANYARVSPLDSEIVRKFPQFLVVEDVKTSSRMTA